MTVLAQGASMLHHYTYKPQVSIYPIVRSSPGVSSGFFCEHLGKHAAPPCGRPLPASWSAYSVGNHMSQVSEIHKEHQPALKHMAVLLIPLLCPTASSSNFTQIEPLLSIFFSHLTVLDRAVIITSLFWYHYNHFLTGFSLLLLPPLSPVHQLHRSSSNDLLKLK